MEQLNFDSGVKEFNINGKGVLRFNPSDPNVYGRFMDAVPKIEAIEKKQAAKAKLLEGKGQQETGEGVIRIMRETDAQMKAVLNEVFGHGNDFNGILEGVNLMAVARNGKRVVSYLIDALLPIMEAGAKASVEGEVETAKLNREQRRAVQ